MIAPGLLLIPALFACGDKDGGGSVEVLSATATVSPDVATVVTVTWETDVESTGYVRYRAGDDVFQSSVTALGTTHSVPLLGLAADTSVEYQVVAQVDGVDRATGDLLSVTTGSLPTELPGTNVEGGSVGNYLITPLIGATTGPVIISPRGDIVWYHVDDRNLDVYRARILLDGSGIIYSAASVSGDPAANSALVKVPWDGSSETEIPVPLLAHDFVQLPDGTITTIAVKYGDGPDGEIRGDKLVEIAPDGTQTEIWSAWDCFDPAVETGDEPELGWTFVNALDYDEEEDAYYVGIRNFSSIVKLDRATASCEWVVGDFGATIDIEGRRFIHQHQFEVNGNQLVVFDNEGAGGTKSRAIEYELDLDNGVATEVWNYTPDPSIYSFVLGDVHRFDDGDTLVTWSVAGQIDRVTADGVPEWSVNTDLGYAFGFNTVVEDLYE